MSSDIRSRAGSAAAAKAAGEAKAKQIAAQKASQSQVGSYQPGVGVFNNKGLTKAQQNAAIQQQIEFNKQQEINRQLALHGLGAGNISQQQFDVLSGGGQAAILRQQEEKLVQEELIQQEARVPSDVPKEVVTGGYPTRKIGGATVPTSLLSPETEKATRPYDITKVGGAYVPTSLIEPDFKTTEQSFKQSQKDLQKFLSQPELQGAQIDIVLNGKVIGTTSGQRAYYDILKAGIETKGQAKIYPKYTISQKAFVANFIRAAESYGATTFQVKEGGKIIETLPLSKAEAIAPELIASYQRMGKQLQFSFEPVPENLMSKPTKGFVPEYDIRSEQLKKTFPQSPEVKIGAGITIPIPPEIKGFARGLKEAYKDVAKSTYDIALTPKPIISDILGTTQDKEIGEYVQKLERAYPKELKPGPQVIEKVITEGKFETGEGLAYDIGNVAGLASVVVPGTKALIPIRTTKITIPTGEGKFEDVYKGIKLGYSKEITKPSLGISEGKFIKGIPKPEELPLEKFVAPKGRGGYPASEEPTGLLYKPEYVAELERLGKIPKGEGEIINVVNKGLKEAGEIPDIIKRTELGEKPFVPLEPSETKPFLGAIGKEQRKIIEPVPPVKGSLIEQFFVRGEGLTPSRDVDIQFEGIRALERGRKAAKTFSKELQEVAASPTRQFSAEDTRVYVSELIKGSKQKVFEGLTKKDVSAGSQFSDASKVFGQKVPRQGVKLGKIKGFPYRFQGLRKGSSVTEITPQGVRPAKGREKDYLSLYNYFLTKAEDATGLGKKGLAKSLKGRAEFVKQFAEQRGLFPKQPTAESLVAEVGEPTSLGESFYSGGKSTSQFIGPYSISTARPTGKKQKGSVSKSIENQQSSFIKEVSSYSTKPASSIRSIIASGSKPSGVKSKPPPSPTKSYDVSPFKSTPPSSIPYSPKSIVPTSLIPYTPFSNKPSSMPSKTPSSVPTSVPTGTPYSIPYQYPYRVPYEEIITGFPLGRGFNPATFYSFARDIRSTKPYYELTYESENIDVKYLEGLTKFQKVGRTPKVFQANKAAERRAAKLLYGGGRKSKPSYVIVGGRAYPKGKKRSKSSRR